MSQLTNTQTKPSNALLCKHPKAPKLNFKSRYSTDLHPGRMNQQGEPWQKQCWKSLSEGWAGLGGPRCVGLVAVHSPLLQGPPHPLTPYPRRQVPCAEKASPRSLGSVGGAGVRSSERLLQGCPWLEPRSPERS